MIYWLKQFGLTNLALSLAGGALSWAIYKDYDELLSGTLHAYAPERKIAEITGLQEEVKTRPGVLPVFKEAYQGDTLREGDYLFVGPDSSASLQFTGGQRARIHENTLIVIQAKKEKPNLRLVKGAIEGEGRLDVHLERHGQRVQVDGKVSIEAQSREKFKVLVTQGRGEVGQPGTPPKLVNEHHNLSFAAGGATITKNPFRSITPSEGQKVESGQPVQFSWQGPEAVIEVSPNRRFQPILLRVDGKSPTQLNLVKFHPGVYFWRLRSESMSSVRSFRVWQNHPVVAYSPDRKSQLYLGAQSGTNHIDVMFRWQIKKEFKSYDVMIFDGVKRSLVSQFSARRPPHRIRFPRHGNFHWRVRGVRQDGVSPWSQPISFSVRKAKLLKPPLMAQPKTGAVFLASAKQPSVRLAWQNFNPDNLTNVVVSRTPGFEEPIIHRKSGLRQLDFRPQSYGRYYWRVASIDPFGASTPFSPPSTFKLAPSQNFLSSPKKAEVVGQGPLEFRWRRLWLARSYRVEISRTSAFREVKSLGQTSQVGAKSEGLKEGQYYWRVVAELETGQKVKSHIWPFRVGKASALRPPDLKDLYIVPQH